jgi:predicted phosphohydrolase
MIIDCCADLHGNYPTLDGGDLLIVAGDLTARDTEVQHKEFFEWLDCQSYQQKVYIAGNHDNYYKKNSAKEMIYPSGIIYLEDSGAEFEYEIFETTLDSTMSFARKKKLKIWGSPWTLTFPGINPKCTAFTGDEKLLAEKFSLIPDDIDILVTHGPPYGIFDKTCRNELVGSKELLIKVAGTKPLIHCFGHIHEKGGKEMWKPWKNATRFINCSHVNEHYEPVNEPIRIIL